MAEKMVALMADLLAAQWVVLKACLKVASRVEKKVVEKAHKKVV